MAASEEAVSAWSCVQVAHWLQKEGFGEYVDLLCARHRLDGLGLLALTEADLRGPPLGLAVLGDIKRLVIALRRLQRRNQSQLEELGLQLADGGPAGSSLAPVGDVWKFEGADGRFIGGDGFCSESMLRQRRGERCGYGSGETLRHTHFNGRCRQHLAGRLDPEVWKTVVSSIYVFLVIGFTSFVMVLVHERVPDMRTYPPLPDIFLDRYCTCWAGKRFLCASCYHFFISDLHTDGCFCLPTVFPESRGPLQWRKPAALSCVTCFCWSCSFTNTGSWLFQLFPSCGPCLMSILAQVHGFGLWLSSRSILFRRLCSLMGTVFLLRCCTMFVTSLSVPGQHLKCASKVGKNGSGWDLLLFFPPCLQHSLFLTQTSCVISEKLLPVLFLFVLKASALFPCRLMTTPLPR